MVASPALATPIILSDSIGLAAEVEFTILSPTLLQVRVRNISPDVPHSFSGADQILTVVSWDFGLPGKNASDPRIIGGSAQIGPDSKSINFSKGKYGPGKDIGGEWGYSNEGSSGSLINSIGTNASGTVPFGGPNLDGWKYLGGPSGGLVTDPLQVCLGNESGIQDEIFATLKLSQPITSLSEVTANGVRVEFGCNAAFITVPEPASLCLLAIGALWHFGRRKRSAAASSSIADGCL